MDFVRFYFDYSPLLIPLCLAVGLLYALLLYSRKTILGRQFINRLLFALRVFLVASIAFLLIGPSLRLTVTEQEKPALVVLVDNSSSVRETVDSATWQALYGQLQDALKQLNRQGFETPIRTLDGEQEGAIRFTHASSDIDGGVHRILEEYEGRNLAGLIVVSDGVYNSGQSPLYSLTKAPIYTLGVGDTVQHMDASIKHVVYNKIVRQGDFFPLYVEALLQKAVDKDITVTVYHKGKSIAGKTQNAQSDPFMQFYFEVEAKEKGLHQFDVVMSTLPGEKNTKNNRAMVYVEVVGGKKKILIITPAPHPDNKAIRAAIATNANYDVDIYMPEVQHTVLAWTGQQKPDLVVLRYAGGEKKIASLLDSIKKHSIPLFIMLGEGADLLYWKYLDIPVSFERNSGKREVHPVLNPKYSHFNLPDRLDAVFARYPSVSIAVKNIAYPPNAEILLFQRADADPVIKHPLLITLNQGGHAIAVLLGDNVWRWRMSEFAEYGSTEGFDAFFSKLIQYLSMRENRSRFKSFPLQNEFTTAEPILFESQVYNALFEPVYGYPITMELTDEQGKNWSYRYVTGPHRSQYALGLLKEGVYQYRSSTVLEGKKKVVKGLFRVAEQHIESQNLVADFNILREWARRTGGAFYPIEKSTQLALDFESREAVRLSHSKTSLNELINLKWLFIFLLMLVGIEWIMRKFLGYC